MCHYHQSIHLFINCRKRVCVLPSGKTLFSQPIEKKMEQKLDHDDDESIAYPSSLRLATFIYMYVRMCVYCTASRACLTIGTKLF